MAERVVHDLEVVEVDEEDRADVAPSLDGGRGRSEDPLEAHLEHPPVGGACQGVALGEVLDAPQEHSVAEVEGGDRAELAEDRGEPPRDAGDDAAAGLDDDGSDGFAVRDHR